jgi:hypothetical protein
MCTDACSYKVQQIYMSVRFIRCLLRAYIWYVNFLISVACIYMMYAYILRYILMYILRERENINPVQCK